MADNTTLSLGTGGDVIATDDVAGVKYPRTKIQTGGDGVAGGDVTATNPLDVRIGDATNTASVKAASTAAAATDKALVVAISPNNTVPISAAALPLPSGAATAANQTTLGNATTKINDGTNTAAVKAASATAAAADPAIVVSQSPNGPATYNATTGAFTPASAATDVFVITGSASKTVRVLRIIIEATQTTGAVNTIQLIRRSADNTAGTSATPTKVQLDTNDAAPTAVVRNYTANPTGLGVSVGNVRVDRIFVPATTAQPDRLVWDFTPASNERTRGLVLRGATQILAVNLNGVTWTGGSLTISVEWTEE